MWDHLPGDVLAHVAEALATTADRQRARAVCRSWRSALDMHWRRGCFLARCISGGDDRAARLLPRFRALAAVLWPRLRELDLVELNAERAAVLLPELLPTAFPQLVTLGLSTPLGEQCADGGKLARLQLPLRELRLADVRLAGGLQALARLGSSLTALHIASTQAGNGGLGELGCLTSFSNLQALSLPALDQQARDVLPLLTTLTSLSFEAEGSGAVGANLLPLRGSLCSLRIQLHHRREHFLVLHPAVEWQALAQLSGLTSLEVLSWAAGRKNAAPLLSAPVYIWADQSVLEEHAAVLLAGLPALQRLCITAAYCRLDQPWGSEDAAGEEGPAVREVACAGRSRRWAWALTRVPVQRAGSSRGDEWNHAWWQADVQGTLQAAFGQADPSVLRYRAATHNVAGWSAIHPQNPATYDLELECLQE